MRGQITYFSDIDKSGEIKGEDGQRYRFALDDLLYENTLRYHALVLFEGHEGRAVSIDVLDEDGCSIGGGPDVIEDNLSIWGFFKRAMSQKYFDFEGRARRKEYWSFTLFYFLINLLLGLALMNLFGLGFPLGAGGNPAISGVMFYVMAAVFLLMFVFFIPSISVLVRRLHDIGLSGWVILISLVPMIGSIALLVMTLWPTSAGRNQYGPAPLHGKKTAEENFDL